MEAFIIGVALAVTGQFIGLLFVLFKTYPTISTKVDALVAEVETLKQKDTKITDAINVQGLDINTAKTEMTNLRKEFDADRESTKEIHKELRKAMEENTRAIISLEVTLKHLNNRLEEKE
jgi:uncharacterized coiled-coil DUF342 family protein